MKYRVAIDIGAESGRAIVGYLSDGIMHLEEIHRFTTRDVYVRGKRIRNVYRWYEEIITALKKYVINFGTELDSIGVNAMGHEFSLVDSDGNLCYLPCSYRDCSFGKQELDRIIEKNLGDRKIYSITGNQASEADPFTQLIIGKQNRKSVFEKAEGILFLADTIHYLLGAYPCAELSLASYSRLVEQLSGTWSNELFNAFDFNSSLQSKIVAGGSIIGKVEKNICDTIGFTNQPLIITPCGHDTADAVLAVPNCGKNSIFISSGTWSLIGYEIDRPIINEESYKINASNSSTAFGKYMYKKNVAGMWLIQQCNDIWGLSFDEITKRAAESDSNGVYIDVDAPKFKYSTCMLSDILNDIKTNYCLSINQDDVGTISRIIFESMALKDKYMIDLLDGAIDLKAERIIIVGGGTQNKLLCQMISNVTNLPVITGQKEATALGNLLVQAYGEGEINSYEEMKAITNASTDLSYYYPQNVELWEEKYNNFREESIVQYK